MQKISTLIIAFLLFTSLLFSQAGVLDPSFANGGIMLWDVSGGQDTGKGIAVQEDGKIVIAGSGGFTAALAFDIYVVRLNEDGSVDPTFATDGVYRYANPLGSDLLFQMDILEDGKILVAGSHGASAPNPEFLLLKLNSDGTPDTTFGTDGIKITTIDVSEDYARCFTFNDAGQIIVGGNSHKPGFGYQRNVVVRYEANGVIDSTFGTNGIFMWNNNNTYNDVHRIAMADDGNILAAGRAAPFGTDRLSVYKILADGSGLDSTWADNGAILAPFEGQAYGMIIHSNGTILLTGQNSTAMGNDLIVLAYNQDGTPKTDFGQDGVFLIDVNISEVGLSIFEQQDGKIVACGESGGTIFSPPSRAFFSVRMDENGVLDTSWGEGTGYVRTETSTWMAFSNASTIQPDGKVLLTGLSAITNNDLTVIRYGNFVDQDMDTYGLGDDCNDLNFDINPGATEIPNNDVDENCDGIALVIDADMDGYDSDKDCDDMNAAVNPGAVEVPYNGLDDDCDATTPDDDLDGDGFILADDCDDTNAYINPNAEEIPNNDIDEDCDGSDLMVGVNETALAQQFKVYPNPATNLVNIDFGSDSPTVESIDILDYTGKKIKTFKTAPVNGQLTISLGDLPKGLWLITIHTTEGVAVKRVVKI